MTRITIPDEGPVVHIVNSPPRSLYLTTVCCRYEEDNYGELVGFWELSEEAVTCMACVAREDRRPLYNMDIEIKVTF